MFWLPDLLLLLINNLLAKNVEQIRGGLSLVSRVLRLLSHKTHANEGVEMRMQQDIAARYGAQCGSARAASGRALNVERRFAPA